MPTTDKDKNLEYVKKSQAKKKEVLGAKEYNKINADNEQRHRDKLKITLGTEEYKRQQAEYMKEYRKKQAEQKKREKSIITLSDAIKARRARQELQKLEKDKQEIKTVNKMFANVYGNRNIDNLINSYLGQLPNETQQRPVGRPRKPRNPVGRPRKDN
jgi:hypothetical protein